MFTREYLDKLSLHKFKSDDDLVNSIKKLIVNFTTKRESLNKNYQDDKSVSAYLYYFFVVNALKSERAFKYLPINHKLSLKNKNLIEIGTGSGAVTWGALQNFDFNKVYLVEQSKLMKKQGEVFFDDFYHGKVNWFDSIGRLPFIDNAVLLFSNSLNEISDTEFIEIVKKVKPKDILFLEPGTKEVFKKIHNLKSHLLEHNYNCTYPCNSKSSFCPSFEADDWCHQYVAIDIKVCVDRIIQKVGTYRHKVPFILQSFSLTESLNEKKHLLYSRPFERKYGHDYVFCSDNSFVKLKELKKNRELEKREIKSLLAGMNLDIEIKKELGENNFEGKLVSNK